MTTGSNWQGKENQEMPSLTVKTSNNDHTKKKYTEKQRGNTFNQPD